MLTEEAREAKSQNKQLKRRVKALLAERDELEAAAAKLEERLESSSRAAQTLQEQVERLSLDRRGEASTAFLSSRSNSNSNSNSPSLSLAVASRTPEASGDARGGRTGRFACRGRGFAVSGGGGGGAAE